MGQQDFAYRVFQLAVECLTDENAKAMSDVSVTLLATLDPRACSIVRDHRSNMLIWNDVSFGVIDAVEKLAPLCIEKKQVHQFLQSHGNAAKDMLLLNQRLGFYSGELPWTQKEIDEAEDRLMSSS